MAQTPLRAPPRKAGPGAGKAPASLCAAEDAPLEDSKLPTPTAHETAVGAVGCGGSLGMSAACDQAGEAKPSGALGGRRSSYSSLWCSVDNVDPGHDQDEQAVQAPVAPARVDGPACAFGGLVDNDESGDDEQAMVPTRMQRGSDALADPRAMFAAGHGRGSDIILNRQREVWLHVYDMGPVTGRLNQFVLRGANLGAFHVGVEVLGDEWSFQGFHDAWDDPTLSGVLMNTPRSHPDYLYRESISLGMTPFDEDAVDAVIDRMMEEWPANTYHIVSRNCVTFAEELVQALQVPEPFPAWVRGAIDAAKAPAIFAIADYGWEWFKWWSKRQAEQEAAEAEAESQRILSESFGVPDAAATTESVAR